MKAVVVHAADDLRIDELPDPEPAADEVVAMEWGGLCGSDISYWRNGMSGTAVLKRPLVLGHEVAGRVVQTGRDVSGIAIGQPVTVHPATPNGGYFGSAALDPHTDGGFSEFRAVRADQLRPLPDGVSTRDAALAEPLAVAMHAVNRAGDVAGRDVLVNGAGPIGSLVIAALRHAGAASVTAADVNTAALRIARDLGADETVDLSAGEELPTGFDLAFEASGATVAIGGLQHALARGATLVQVGNLPGAPAPFALGDLVTREITWIGSYRFDDEITDAVAALRDGLDVSPLITHTFGIDDAARAVATAADRTSGSGKVLIELSPDTAPPAG